MMITNIAVVIRSSHERTEALCEYLIKQQIDEKNVVVIHEKPFSQALRRGFEIGIDYGLDWTLCVDADLLIKSDAVNILVDRIRIHSNQVLGGHGRILDKMYGKTKYAGLHLYRTSLLKETINDIPDATITLRPETYVKKIMASKGHEWVQFSDIVAIHDYEQFYSDIYRTMIVRAKKSKEMVEHLLTRADKLSKKDKDFLICACALRVSLSREEDILLHSEQWREESSFLLKALGMKEKNRIQADKSPKLLLLPDGIIRNFVMKKYIKNVITKPFNICKRMLISS